MNSKQTLQQMQERQNQDFLQRKKEMTDIIQLLFGDTGKLHAYLDDAELNA